MNNDVIRVAMVCNFSCNRVREKLHLSNYNLVNLFRKLLGHNNYKYKDFALWNESIIQKSIGRKDVDLHVISPHSGLKRNTNEFESEGIHYYFFKNKPNPIVKYINKKLFHQKLVRFKHNRKVVEGIIKKINPDLILLVGAETPYYSSTIMGIDNIPIYALCLSVVTNPEFEAIFDKDTFRERSFCERSILKKTKYVGVYSDKHYRLYRKNGYDEYVFKFQWPTSKFTINFLNCEKKYDFVNFANVLSIEKGYHDCIQALAIVKKEFPNVKMALVEKTSKGKVKDELVDLVNQHGLKDNVDFIPFFKEKKDLYAFIQTSRFAVLPCKVDYISGTMLDAMVYGLPTVVYETEGTPTINTIKETVLIAKMCDIGDLANKMLELMKNEDKALSLRQHGFDYMEAYISERVNGMDNLVNNFRAIIQNYRQGTEIPQEQIYID